MATDRTWAYVAGGAGIVTLAVSAWAWTRPRAAGVIHELGGKYYVDAQVVSDLRGLVPGARLVDPGRYSVPLHERGRLDFRVARTAVGELFEVALYPDPGELLSVLVELVRYGLARPGKRYSVDPTKNTRAPDLILSEALPTRPLSGGHYFVVGEKFYADEAFRKTLEHFVGADFEADAKSSMIPVYRRGALRVRGPFARFRALPEQVGTLHVIESELTGVTLRDYLIELEHYGLVAWGGEWPQLPTGINVAAKGMPPRTPRGLVAVRDGGVFVSKPVLDILRTRLPHTGVGDSIVWRGQTIEPRPSSLRFESQPEERAYALGDVGDFAAELVLHRMARLDEREQRPEVPPGTVRAPV